MVPAVDNAIAIIEHLNSRRPAAATLAEISSALVISKSHCHYILKTLQFYDWLRFDERAKTYELSSGILASASRVLNIPARDIIRRELTALVAKVGFPCVLSQPLKDDTFMLMDKFNDAQAMEISLPIGHCYPRDACAQMRALLAWQSPERIAEWMGSWRPVRYTERTPVTVKAVRAEIDATRRRGYARSVGEFTEGLMAIALPIFDRAGEVSFVFNCSAPIAAMKRHEATLANAMQQAAAAIHRELLARPPRDFPTLEPGKRAIAAQTGSTRER